MPAWLPKIAGRKLFQEYYLAIDEAAAVRGGLHLETPGFLDQRPRASIADFQLPISEGAVNEVIPRSACNCSATRSDSNPCCSAWASAATTSRSRNCWSPPVGACFRSLLLPRGASFGLSAEHDLPAASGRHALDARRLALTGAGMAGHPRRPGVGCRKPPLDPAIAVEPVDEFSDLGRRTLASNAKGQYGMTAVRDAETLRILYPQERCAIHPPEDQRALAADRLGRAA